MPRLLKNPIGRASLLIAVLAFGWMVTTTQPAAATITPYISFQGKLTNPDGTNVNDGSYSITFSLYTVASGGTATWSESKSVAVSSGLFQTNLGDTTALPGSVNFNSNSLYLGVKVSTDAEMTPRVQLTSSAQAFNADRLNGMDSNSFVQLSPGAQQTGNINVSGTVNGQTIGSSSTLSGTLTIQGAGALTLGTSSTNQGAIVLRNAAGANTVTLQAPAANPSSSFSLTLPSALGSSGNCLKQNDASGTLAFGACATTLQDAYDNSSSPATITTTAAKGLRVAAGAAPTVNMLSIDNTGQAVTTNNANGLAINYIGGNAAVEAAGMRIDYTPGSTSGSTWSGLRIVANATGPASGVTTYGIKLEGPTSPGAGSEVGLGITSGFDIGVDINSGGLELSSMSDPASPAASSLRVFAQTRAGRTLLKIKGPSGLSTALQPALFANKIGWWTAQGNGTTVSVINLGNTASGTATTRNVATTNLFTSIRRVGYVSATTAGSVAGTRHAAAQFWIGSASNVGGFYYVARFGISQIQTGMRTLVGLSATTAAFSNADPSTFLSTIGFGCDAADTQFTFMHNSASGTATKDALTGSFPCNTANADMYEARIFMPPGSTTAYYSLEDLSSGALYDGSTTTKLPTNTTLMSPQIWVNNGVTAAAVAIDVSSQYIETDN
ncbi:MAG TPA: hypothetical protein VMR45_02980 [Patescibacteria group bacterium]|nr:hypothetical protein [Patescibacteria group bacterium]